MPSVLAELSDWNLSTKTTSKFPAEVARVLGTASEAFKVFEKRLSGQTVTMAAPVNSNAEVAVIVKALQPSAPN